MGRRGGSRGGHRGGHRHHGGGRNNGLGGLFYKEYNAATDVHEWSSSLTGCFGDCGSCLDAFYCPYCTMGYLFHEVVHHGQQGEPKCCTFGCIYPCLIDFSAPCVGSAITNCHIRAAITNHYKIKDDSDACARCCLSCWCLNCALAQQHRELSKHGEFPGGCFAKKPRDAPERPPPPVPPTPIVMGGMMVDSSDPNVAMMVPLMAAQQQQQQALLMNLVAAQQGQQQLGHINNNNNAQSPQALQNQQAMLQAMLAQNMQQQQQSGGGGGGAMLGAPMMMTATAAPSPPGFGDHNSAGIMPPPSSPPPAMPGFATMADIHTAQ